MRQHAVLGALVTRASALVASLVVTAAVAPVLVPAVPAGAESPAGAADAASPAGAAGTAEGAGVVGGAGGASPVAAADTDDGLRAEAKTTFVVDQSCPVHVTTQVTLTNQVSNVDRGDVVQQYYFYRYAVPVLSEATSAHARRSDGTPLTVNLRPSEDAAQDWVKFAEIDLNPNLLFGETQTIVLSYLLPCQPPRSPGLSRSNDALVMFPAFSPGDPNLTSIEVRLPPNFNVEVTGDALDQRQADGQTVLTASAIENPDEFTSIVVATDDDRLVTKHVQADGRDVEVQAWPDDREWVDFVGNELGKTMPALEGLIGMPWPTERNLQVIETASPYAHGYAGWYSQVDHSISLGDQLDSLVVAHELSHVWFNENLFDARWINEGLADEYAQTTLQQLHETTVNATAPDRSSAAAVALNDWSTPSLLEQQDDATEDYGYAASWYVLDQIAAEIGVDKMRAVIAAVAHDRITYTGDPDPEQISGVTGWQRLLDQLQNVGGSRKAPELFDQYVVTDDQRSALTDRTSARQAYAALAERGGEWTPPLALRLAMTNWDFDGAGSAIIQANGVLDVRDDLDAVLDGLDVGHLQLEDDYESGRELDDVSAEATATLDAARAYRTADERMDEGVGIFGRIGLIGSGTDGELDDAAVHLAAGDTGASLDASAAVGDDLDGATRNGLLRLAGLAVVLGLVVVGVRRRPGRGRRRQRSAQREIDQLEALYARRPASSETGPRRTADPVWGHTDPDRPN